MSDEPKHRESIWQPLDGSAPTAPKPEPAGLSFTKPQAGQPVFPVASAEAVSPVDPATGRAVYVLADWWPRLGAYIIDGVIFGLALLCVTIPAGVALGLTVQESAKFFGGGLEVPESATSPNALWALLALQFLMQPTLQAVFLGRWNGQTPGKRIIGLRVVTEEGTPMTIGRGLKRELVGETLIVGVLSVLTLGVAYFANYLWPLRDAQNRAGHDFFAKTRVVVERR